MDTTKATTSKKPRHSTKSQTTSSSSNVGTSAEESRQTNTHMFFWAGALSNRYKRNAYSGSRALALTTKRLDENNIHHPAESTLSSRLLAAHSFNCGEQWLMAMKGWLFERDIEYAEKVVTDEEFESLLKQMIAQQPPSKEQPRTRELYFSTLCSVLRAKSLQNRWPWDENVGISIQPFGIWHQFQWPLLALLHELKLTIP